MKIYKNFFFFWKHQLGQWNMKSFVDNKGIVYNCAEQYMMAKKALLFEDTETYEKIMKSNSPKEHQDLGRQVKNFNQKIWDANAVSIVYQGNLYKFSQNEELLKILMDTKGLILVEASPFDKIWGIGLGENEREEVLTDLTQWKGLNLLGFTLTNLRDNYFLNKS